MVRVVVGPDARLVQNLGAGTSRDVEERANGGALGRAERDLRLAKP